MLFFYNIAENKSVRRCFFCKYDVYLQFLHILSCLNTFMDYICHILVHFGGYLISLSASHGNKLKSD